MSAAGWTIIEPRAASTGSRGRETWASRRLIEYFGRRLLSKLYARTKLGVLWLPLRPVLDVGARALLFGALLGAPSEGLPYTLFLLVGMTPFMFVDRSLFWSVRSIELNAGLAKRLYFPRIVLPLAAYLPSLLDLAMYILLVALAIAGFSLFDGTLYLETSSALLLAPAGFVLCFALTFGTGLILSVLGAQTRDVRFSLAYVTQVWFFVTPVAFPLSAVPDGYQTLAGLNPLCAPIELIREGLVGAGTITGAALASSVVASILVCFAGFRFFHRAEAEVVDSL